MAPPLVRKDPSAAPIAVRHFALGGWMLVAALGAGCGSRRPGPTAELTPPAPATEAPAATPPVAATPVLAVKPLAIAWADGKPLARLLADGRTEAVTPEGGWTAGPTLRADGIIILTKGWFTARLGRDGAITVVPPAGSRQGEQPFGRIEGDELRLASTPDAWAVRIEDDVIRYSGPTPPNRIEGPVDADARRLALVMTAAFYIDLSITGP